MLEEVAEATFTSATIKRMWELINRAKTDATFQKLIYGIVNRAMPGRTKDYRGELNTIFNWSRKAVNYRRDPYGVELVQDVWATLDRRRGDCDDFTILLAAAAEVLGCPSRIVTVSTRPNREPNHVYPEANVGGQWVSMDATVHESYLGWQPSRITAKKIWTRRDLGLAGGDDISDVEGLPMGMGLFEKSPWKAAPFTSAMRPVSGGLAPNIPSDISQTYAHPMTGGPAVISQRRIDHAKIANNADWTSQPRPGGGVYAPALPIRSFPTPRQLWYLAPRMSIPRPLNPTAAWGQPIPTAVPDSQAPAAEMEPASEVSMSNYLMDIASAPGSTIDGIAAEVIDQLKMGEIGMGEIEDAILDGLEEYAELGYLDGRRRRPGMRRLKSKKKGRGRRPNPKRFHPTKLNNPGGMFRDSSLPPQFDAPKPLQLSGYLGDTIADIANTLTKAVSSGEIPTDPASINKAIDAALTANTARTSSATIATAQVAKAGIPLAAFALIAIAGLAMGGRKYKSNPSRRYRRSSRRSYSRRGRKGGLDKNLMMALGLGVGGYFLLINPKTSILPSVPKTATTAPKPVLDSNQAMIAAGVKAVPGVVDAITKFFSSEPAPQTSMVTSWDQVDQTQQGSSIPGLVTAL